MRRTGSFLAGCLTAALLGLVPGGRADDPAKPAPTDAAKEMAAIQKDWTQAQVAFGKAYREAKTNEERQQVLKEKRPKPEEYAERCLKLAEAHPGSPEEIKALVWAVANARGTPASGKAMTRLKDGLLVKADLNVLDTSLSGAPGYNLAEFAPLVAEKAKKNLDHPKAAALLVWVATATAYGQTPELSKLYNQTVDLLAEKFPDRHELLPLCALLASDDDPPWAEKKLRTFQEKNSNGDVNRAAKLALAQVLQNKDVASQPEAEKLFKSIVEEATGNPQQRQHAESALAEMKVRGLGKAAPEIAGLDLDDHEFKLSDYKGKVVLLDFWGFW
jgi:hypothetical protein